MPSLCRYVPVPEAPQGESVYSQWYKQTYPDTVVGLAATSNEGLVSVDNAGTVRLWETGVANLQGWRLLPKRLLTDCCYDGTVAAICCEYTAQKVDKTTVYRTNPGASTNIHFDTLFIRQTRL